MKSHTLIIMGRKEQANIMSIEFSEEYISSLKNKKYVFKTLDDSLLTSDFKIYMFKNKKGFDFKSFDKNLIDKYNIYENIYCFIYFPYWQKKDRIVEYLKLKKYLKKNEFKDFDFSLEKEYSKNNYQMYYGIVKINKNNLSELLELISLWNTGIMFTWEEIDNKFYYLVDKLSEIFESDELPNEVEKAKLMNIIINCNKDSTIINSYIWEEFEDYHVDIFVKK